MLKKQFVKILLGNIEKITLFQLKKLQVENPPAITDTNNYNGYVCYWVHTRSLHLLLHKLLQAEFLVALDHN